MGRELFISLGITILTSVTLFLYFRNRFKVVEHKVNTIFQLVQSHSRPQAVRQPPPAMCRPPPQEMSPDIVLEEKVKLEPQLIEVSEDEYTDSEGDSEGDSDSENSEISDKDGSPIQITQLSAVDDIKIEPASNIEISQPQNINLETCDLASLSDQSSLSSHAESVHADVMEDLSKQNMVSLRKIAEGRGLDNYKKLRKPALIELLSK